MGLPLRTALATLALLAGPLVHAGQVVLPADISVQLSAQPNTNIVPGEPIIFTVTVVNNGPESVDRLVLISSDFYDQIDLNYGSSDCQGVVLSVTDGKTFHFNYSWNPTLFDGPLMVGESRTCNITLALTGQAPPIWPFSFAIPAFIEDIDSTNNAATVILRRGDIAPRAIPMLSPIVLLMLAIGLATIACWFSRQRQSGHRGER